MHMRFNLLYITLKFCLIDIACIKCIRNRDKWIFYNIIPHFILSFLTLYISSGRYFAVFCVILITPAAPVVICTEYRPRDWHSTFFFKMRTVRQLFVQSGIGFYRLPFTRMSSGEHSIHSVWRHYVKVTTVCWRNGLANDFRHLLRKI